MGEYVSKGPVSQSIVPAVGEKIEKKGYEAESEMGVYPQ